jgi:hypothetical protein
MHPQPPARLLAATVISATALTLTAAPVSAATHHLSGTQAASAAPNPVCLDATNSRADNTKVRLWGCVNHTNQKWVIQGGQIKVEDTIGTSRPVCLDATNSRADNTTVRLWGCLNHTNQKWIIQGGQIKVEDTLS